MQPLSLLATYNSHFYITVKRHKLGTSCFFLLISPVIAMTRYVNKLIPALEDLTARSLDSERLERAQIARRGSFRTHEIMLRVNKQTHI